MMFRQEEKYLSLVKRIRLALNGVGCKDNDIINFKAYNFMSHIRLNGLEELMLSTWAMMKYIKDYLEKNNLLYENGQPFNDLFTSVHCLIKFIHPLTTNSFFLADEAGAMEKVSRAAYAWMKTHRLLRKQDPYNSALDWPMMG